MPITSSQIVLTEAQRVWLRGLYAHLSKGYEIDARSLKVELLDQLPSGFTPSDIDERLLRDGVRLSVLGMALLDPENKLVRKTNQVIYAIELILRQNPKTQSIHVDQVARIIAMEEDQVAVIFEKLAETSVLHDSGTKYSVRGWATINISERAFHNYLKYQNLDQIVQALVTDGNSVSSKVYDVFLSYASADRLEATQIYDAVIAVGRRAFLSEKNLKAGDDFEEEIRKALRESRELWLLLSPDSSKSEWVISEWAAAWALGIRIVPILFRCSPQQLSQRIQRLHYIDFHKYPELIQEKFSP